MTGNRNFFILSGLLLFFVSGACATRQIKMEQAVLKQYVDALQESNADSSQSLTEIREEQQHIKGELERIQHLSGKDRESLEERISKLEASNEELSGNLEQIKKDFSESLLKIEKLISSQSASKSAGNESGQKLSIDARYKNARNSHIKKDYDKAESFYLTIVGSRSKWYDERARFYLGTMYYDMANYKQSVITLQEMVEKYPNSQFVPTAVLVQGKAFLMLNQKKEAEVFFRDLISRFPGSKEAKEAEKRLSGK
ncbi:MAG: tetratricopeptide repeat protein [Oligoflexia bacterium]|nr:tetratricopeptide repeat protein [Oligoflexia bacterium]